MRLAQHPCTAASWAHPHPSLSLISNRAALCSRPRRKNPTNTRATWRKCVERGVGLGGWGRPVLVEEVFSVRSSERGHYRRELSLAASEEGLGEGRDAGHRALVRNGSGNRECELRRTCQGSWCLASAPKTQHIGQNPVHREPTASGDPGKCRSASVCTPKRCVQKKGT